MMVCVCLYVGVYIYIYYIKHHRMQFTDGLVLQYTAHLPLLYASK